MGTIRERQIAPRWYLYLGASLVSGVSAATLKEGAFKLGFKARGGGISLIKNQRSLFTRIAEDSVIPS